MLTFLNLGRMKRFFHYNNLHVGDCVDDHPKRNTDFACLWKGVHCTDVVDVVHITVR